MRGELEAIDCTHIAIKAPHRHQENYINRKGFHSIRLQCVCDQQMMFTDCFAVWPGSVHDVRVLCNLPCTEMLLVMRSKSFQTHPTLLVTLHIPSVPGS